MVMGSAAAVAGGERKAPEERGGPPGMDDPATMPLERLEADLLSWAADLAAAEARWLLWLAEYDRRRGWAHWEQPSCARWLNWKCGLSHHAATEKVRVANALVSLPELTAAFCEGRLSYSKVRAITRVAIPEDERDWLTLALSTTAAQLERMVAAQRGVCEPDSTEAFAARSVSRRSLDEGRRRLIIDLPIDAEETVWAAIEQRVEAIIADAADDDQKPHDVIRDRGGRAAVRADALVAIATDALAADDDSGARVDVDRERRPGHLSLVAELDKPASELEGEPVDVAVTLNGCALAGPVAQRWMCDIDTSVVLESSDGIPVGETDKRRTPNRAMRRRLERRAGHRCEFEGCSAQRRLKAHHIIHWVAFGPTEFWNLLLVCDFHHHLLHEGGWSVQGKPGIDLRFVAPSDEPPHVTRHRTSTPTSTPDALVDRHRAAGFRPQLVCHWDGGGLDYAFTSQILAHNRKLALGNTEPHNVATSPRGDGEPVGRPGLDGATSPRGDTRPDGHAEQSASTSPRGDGEPVGRPGLDASASPRGDAPE